MKHSLYTLLIIACTWSIQSNAQTPYDSFAPETSRPMLGILEKSSADTVSSIESKNTTFTTDDIRKWMSVDPLADKYPNISPYAYCGWNPVKYKDPNGKWLETAWDIANVAMDISSLKSNISNDNVGGAVVDGIGLMLDLGATILPAVPGGAGTAIKASRVADKISDAASMSKQGQKAKGIGNYIVPNGGKAKPHGGIKHNSAIDKYIDDLPKEATNIRKNQAQVEINGKKVGTNRPDVQYDMNGQHMNVEFDTKPENGLQHQQTIQNNDPNTKVILKIVE